MESNAVLSLAAVGVTRRGKQILRDVSFSIRKGEHWAMLGANGAGKSTLLSLCGAQAHPTSGIVTVLGERIGRVELQALRRRIGHVNPRHPLTSALTIEDVVLTGLTGSVERTGRWEPTGAESRHARELLSSVGLGSKTDSLWTDLSQGERTRVLIARALVIEPELLLLDEPSTGLDVAAREQLVVTLENLARQRPDLTTLLVTHHLEELPGSTTHAMLVREGEVTQAGSARHVLTTDHVSNAFRHPIRIAREDGRWSARTDSMADVRL
ncbi:ABC transporter ATP-binding protein [Microbacterium arborescens]|uniref:ABC transporter ATP-binding protein n=1 Tax=Microbacterium arborescens TaxID=33883 RepID=UPI003C738507